MPIFIPDLFGSYVKGREEAIKSNWNDLSNYGTNLNNQIVNAYNLATFDPRVRSQWNAGANSDMRTAMNAADADRYLERYGLENRYGIPEAEVRTRNEELNTRGTQLQTENLMQGNVQALLPEEKATRLAQLKAERARIDAEIAKLNSAPTQGQNPQQNPSSTGNGVVVPGGTYGN